ncbi:thioredoxin family protein [Actinomycetospora sp. TBRC 11914]|uniref:TlpA family protein disulfide reductase n=1 Tax=Actinomycetospora sp. TBRC 11914 TaxID=2729387 RepID=UPI00145F8F12|nr:thioredoxin family protein [Actinomycetospora sp. TBRC 11914]NMO93685.1 thioredoxin family protein [Actinomycetospora sp. TBRC 11914]
MTAAVVTLAVIVVAGAVVLAVGLRRRRPASGPGAGGDSEPETPPTGTPAAGLLPTDLAARDGRLVLLQFSSAFSRSCRDTHSVLDDVAAELPGLVHRDVDLATRPELVRLLGLQGTPTTLLVDGRGRELLRVSGVPRRAALVSAIEPHLPAGD